ncbi:hypothetical protein OV203_10065 [Nannocystis sp. ILAH1]|uniref:hypothetical protein n=1 Tax=unclassified Nannocystis TaxID=2627009 RepID=UPI00226D9F21|nr:MULTISPECIES: hypothetical protein [unclassified Nannocystis]MCY0987469.1 hypothetical protein [Nannocystis sp. ILAH1]MCY1070736.1 hypothetical protein [Nannocystis sp. RBIL2]
MMSLSRSFPKNVSLALALAVAAGSLTACGGSSSRRKGKQSEARKWIDNPTSGTKDGNKIKIPQIGLEFEIPDTLYVFKNCEETGHSKGELESNPGWVTIASCSSGGVSSSDEDLGASASSDSEAIALTFYLAPKERPVDERAVAFYRNQYQEAGLSIEDLSFNDGYFDKTGIYAKLQVVDESGNATREIQQFMFPYGDVLYIARTEYPYGDTRAIQQDWKAIMPYFRVSLAR